MSNSMFWLVYFKFTFEINLSIPITSRFESRSFFTITLPTWPVLPVTRCITEPQFFIQY